jgi:hypothetical protein
MLLMDIAVALLYAGLGVDIMLRFARSSSTARGALSAHDSVAASTNYQTKDEQRDDRPKTDHQSYAFSGPGPPGCDGERPA